LRRQRFAIHLHFRYKYHPLNEAELVKYCQKNDKKAQEILFLRYSERLFRLSNRYVRSAEDAEDCVITAFAKIFSAICGFTYHGEGSLEGWLRRIVINQSLMCLRKDYSFALTESIDNTMPVTDLSELSKLEADDILTMILDLPVGYRTVFNLYAIDGYSHEEIGKALNISESTSRSQLFKARALLKKMLVKAGYNYGT
jgi:RNA polymerase sigma factor (sigma-70 family)